MNRLYIKTLGCKVNYAESDGLANYFKNQGYEIVESENKADIILLNTCAVTKEAEKSSFKWLNRYKKKNYQIILTGCLTPLLKEKQFPENGRVKVLSLEEKQRIVERENILPSRRRVFLKIVDGCDHFCCFCLVGRIRGKIRSVGEDWIVKECERLRNLGIKEIVLCGINLGLYGKDIGTSLQNLLSRLAKEIKNVRFRLSSLEVDTISEELLLLMIQLVKDGILCPHFHLPLQSASNKILKKMGRRYGIKEYEEILMKIIENLSDANIGCDVMVGYLGEEEEDFFSTYQFLEKMPFGYFHVFPFSKRPLTPVYQEKETISEEAKRRRLKILMNLREKKINEYCQKFFNQVRKGILIEEGIYLTDNYLNVKIFNNLEEEIYIKIKDFYIRNKNFPILIGEEFKGG
ncbi:MAG: radical SAM protein [candidate division WOR-3 bacterium]